MATLTLPLPVSILFPINFCLYFTSEMDRSCPNNLCGYKYNRKKKPFKCPECEAYIGGKFVPTPAKPKKTKNNKVIKIAENYFSVHTNQVYRTVCHVPPGLPASCSFKECRSQKELCERNNTIFTCCHIEEIKKSTPVDPLEELSVDVCRYFKLQFSKVLG